MKQGWEDLLNAKNVDRRVKENFNYHMTSIYEYSIYESFSRVI